MLVLDDVLTYSITKNMDAQFLNELINFSFHNIILPFVLLSDKFVI